MNLIGKCKRRKVNVGKSKVMVLKRVREQNIELAKPHRFKAEKTVSERV